MNLFALYAQSGCVVGGGDRETVGFEEDHYRHEHMLAADLGLAAKVAE